MTRFVPQRTLQYSLVRATEQEIRQQPVIRAVVEAGGFCEIEEVTKRASGGASITEKATVCQWLFSLFVVS